MALASCVTSRTRILIVDDHPIFREGLATIIREQPELELVAQAANGSEAIELYRKHLPAVTLLDLRLPDLSGIEVIRRIRKEDSAARIIVVTTYGGDALALQSLQAGASGYLLKAMVSRELVDAIRAVSEGKVQIPKEVAIEMAQHAADHALSPRELDVLRLVAAGYSNKIIAGNLLISDATVKGHIRNILVKLRANDRTHAVTIALKRGYLEL